MIPTHLIDMMLEDDEDEGPIITEVDLHWAICGRCRGNGFLRGYPGVYTADDFIYGEVDLDDYMEYRRTCEDCDGRGSVRQLDAEAEARPHVREFLDDWYETEAIYAMERRMGA